MALRDLIARVVFKADTSQLDKTVATTAKAESGFRQLDALGAKGVRVNTDVAPIERLGKSIRAIGQGLVEFGERTGFIASGVTSDLAAVAQASQALASASGPDQLAQALDRASQEASVIQQELTRLAQVDPSNPRVDQLKASLMALRGAARESGVALTELGNSNFEGISSQLSGLRVELQGVEGALSPDKLQAYERELDDADKEAQRLRQTILQLRSVDPKNPQLPELAQQLDRVEKEALQTRTALQSLGGGAAQGQAAVSGLTGGVTGLTGAVAGLGIAFGATQILGWVQHTLEAADATGKMAAQLNLATDEYQAWSAFAAQAGAQNEDLRGAFKQLGVSIETAITAKKGPAVDAFNALNIAFEDTEGRARPLSDVLLEVGGAIGELDDDSKRLAVTQTLLSETGLKLLPGFKNGTKAAQEQLEMLRDLAVVYDEDFIANVEAANDEMDLFGRQMEGVWALGINAFLPMLRGFVRFMTPVINKFRDLKENTNLFQAALATLGIAGVQKLFGLVGSLITRFGGWQRVLLALMRVLFRFVAPFLIFEDFLVFLEGGESRIGKIIDKLFGAGAAAEVADTLNAAWKGVVATLRLAWAVLSGDEAAVDEATALFLKATEGMEQVGQDFADFFHFLWRDISNAATEAWDGVVSGVSDGLVAMIAALAGWGDEVSARFKAVWDGFVQMARTAVAGALGAVADFAAKIPFIGSELSGALSKAEASVGGKAATVSSNSSSSTVTINDNSQFQASYTGIGDAGAVSRATSDTQRTFNAQRSRSNRTILRHVAPSAAGG